ncbi:MAG TPA: flagellar basal-body rod protein FlgF [Rhizomicrobium sp.]|jgi:flagellar basal-body rod protein FlgF|nr:flagellar basal-body rod protein FlgF [Rhizomicrobium sp.]
MDNTLLVSLSHQLASYRSMDVIANNLANVSTPAFKREAVQFQEYVSQLPKAEGETAGQRVSFVQDRGVVRDLGEGKFETTNAPFDVAISGQGYFVVSTPNGDRYTRNGHFSLDADGKLITEDGNTVQGDGGEINIQPDAGAITIAQDGTVSGAQGQIGKLRLVNFANERQMKKEGGSLYSTAEAPQAADTSTRLTQGMIETSNVQPVVEISHMIEVMRAYQATSNLSQSHEDLMRRAIDRLGATPN